MQQDMHEALNEYQYVLIPCTPQEVKGDHIQDLTRDTLYFHKLPGRAAGIQNCAIGNLFRLRGQTSYLSNEAAQWQASEMSALFVGT